MESLALPTDVRRSTLAERQAVGIAEIGSAQAIGLTLVATLLSLAILEHFFLVIPLPFESQWKWGLRSRTVG